MLILFDCDDGLGVLHAGKMLDRAGYDDGDIEFGSNDLTRLPHLIVVGDIARVNGSTACAHGSTQLVSKRNDILLEGLAAIGRASCRERVSESGEIWGAGVS